MTLTKERLDEIINFAEYDERQEVLNNQEVVERLKKRIKQYKITDLRFNITIYQELQKILGEKK